MDDVHYSSKKNDWGTPPWLFNLLNRRYGFKLDLFADSDNALCLRYMDDCFNTDWREQSGSKGVIPVAFGNPPYQRRAHGNHGTWDFVAEAYRWAYSAPLDKAVHSVLLLPARTDTKIWHSCVMAKGCQSFIKGRIKFYTGREGKDPAPFPSVIVDFDPQNRGASLGKTISAKDMCYVD